jgi:hypothetical protein
MKRLVVLVIVGLASTAHAQGMTGQIGSGSLTIGNKLWLHQNNNTSLGQPTDPIAQGKYFNYAACECARPNFSKVTPWDQAKYSLEVDVTPDVSQVHQPLQFWVGTSCDNATTRLMTCRQITGDGESIDNATPTPVHFGTYDYPDPTINDISTLQITTFAKPELSVWDLLNPIPNTMDLTCQQRVLDAAQWGLVDTMHTGQPDFFISTTIHADTLPPPLPPLTSFSGEGAESAIVINWGMPSGDVSDILYWQALCADSTGSPGVANPKAAQYVTPRSLCGGDEDVQLQQACATVSDPNDPDAGVCSDVPIPQGLEQLDPAFICGEQDIATATSIRLDGLKNGEHYSVVLLAIDKAGNAAGVQFQNIFTPKPVTDFWEDIHNRGKDIQGGFCLLAETYGDDNPLTQALRGFRDDNLAASGAGRWIIDDYYAYLAPLGAVVHGHAWLRVVAGFVLWPLVMIALAWHFLTLPGLLALIALVAMRRRLRLRRLPRWLVAAPIGVALLVVPQLAHAQAPYWEDPLAKPDTNAEPVAADLPSMVDWNVGIRVGPYIPQIDAQLGLTPGPYQAMFGKNPAWMPLLDVDRVLLRWNGQITIGGTIGYMSRTAHAWVMGSDPADPNRPRSPGDTNTFRLIPLALLASYRFTMLDDEWGVPIVPYARGGLSYYVWWIDGPNGALATIDGKNKAAGASLGFQGAIGLAIRAERIDADAARSMRDSGIYHAGFYGELQAAKVDGFGSATKLSVGDNTWFAGVNFEF